MIIVGFVGGFGAGMSACHPLRSACLNMQLEEDIADGCP